MKINYKLIIDKSRGEFSELLQFAWNNPFRDSLKKSLEHLETMCTNRGDDIVVELYPSAKPMSVKIAFVNTINGNVGTIGGLVYDGPIKGVRMTYMNPALFGWKVNTYS